MCGIMGGVGYLNGGSPKLRENYCAQFQIVCAMSTDLAHFMARNKEKRVNFSDFHMRVGEIAGYVMVLLL